MGEFRWGSFDYLGEAEWPQRCGNFGIIDIAAIPKDAYFLYQSLWPTNQWYTFFRIGRIREKKEKQFP